MIGSYTRFTKKKIKHVQSLLALSALEATRFVVFKSKIQTRSSGEYAAVVKSLANFAVFFNISNV